MEANDHQLQVAKALKVETVLFQKKGGYAYFTAFKAWVHALKELTKSEKFVRSLAKADAAAKAANYQSALNARTEKTGAASELKKGLVPLYKSLASVTFSQAVNHLCFMESVYQHDPATFVRLFEEGIDFGDSVFYKGKEMQEILASEEVDPEIEDIPLDLEVAPEEPESKW